MSADCHFCKLPPERIWLATEHALAFPDSFPISLGHPLVIPVHHIASVFDLSEAQRGTLWALVAKVRVAIHERLRPDGFNIGLNLGTVAGAGITDHVHFHVVPRWNGDTNFMPVLANTTVLPTALNEVAANLRAELGKYS